MHRSVVLVVVVASIVVASRASAQAAGVIITPAYPAQPTQPIVQPVYAQPASPYTTGYGAGACPDGSAPQPDRRGVLRCMHLVSGHRVTWGLAGSGIGLLAGGWVIEILTTVFSSIDSRFGTRDDYVGWGYVPLVGPWIQMTDLPPATMASYSVWLGFEGLLQDAGLLLLIFGIVGEDYEAYQPIAAGELRVRPMLSGTMQGVTLQGAF
jgi:hypothetical protein